MVDVRHAPEQGQQGEPATCAPDAPPLDWNDPAARAAWLAAVRSKALDGIAAGLDATSRKRRRFFSRVEARRRIREADEALAVLFSQGGAP